MAIYPPGHRNRNNRVTRQKKRPLVAQLSLTAMVDMFTVLTVFLLQNYKATGEVISLAKNIQLPKAAVTKELKPAHVIIVSKTEVKVDESVVTDYDKVKGQSDWLVKPLFDSMSAALKRDEAQAKADLRNQIKTAFSGAKKAQGANVDESYKRITVQADKTIDFLTIKKILFTLTEAGASEINFAVILKDKPKGNSN